MNAPYINMHCHQVLDPEELSILNIHDPMDYDSNQLCSVGIHPWHVQEVIARDRVDAFYRLIQNPNVRAIGECGLDKMCATPWEMQLDVFSMQIQWAIEWQKPLMIHCVRSQQEVLKALKNFELGFVFHGFNRNLDMAVHVVNQGGYLSMNEKFLMTQQGIEVAKQIPLNRLFLETDNDPVSVRGAYLCLSQLLEISEKEIAQQFWQNTLEIGLIEG
jgi:TatD DNase family protein